MLTYLANNLPNDLIYKIAINHRSKKMVTLISMKDNCAYGYRCIKNGILNEDIKNINILPPLCAYGVILYLAKTNRKDQLVQASMNIGILKKRKFFVFLVVNYIPIESLLIKYFFEVGRNEKN